MVLDKRKTCCIFSLSFSFPQVYMILDIPLLLFFGYQLKVWQIYIIKKNVIFLALLFNTLFFKKVLTLCLSYRNPHPFLAWAHTPPTLPKTKMYLFLSLFVT